VEHGDRGPGVSEGPWLPHGGQPPRVGDSPWLYVLGTVLMILETLLLFKLLGYF
jgi:hypothetical protein